MQNAKCLGHCVPRVVGAQLFPPPGQFATIWQLLAHLDISRQWSTQVRTSSYNNTLNNKTITARRI